MGHAEDVEDTVPPPAGSAATPSLSEAAAAHDASMPAAADAGAVAGSAVVSIVIALVALATLFAGPIAVVPAIAGMIVSLRARRQLQRSSYRGYGISLLAFLICLGVFVVTAVPIILPFASVLLFALLP
ncbi:type III secretory pathway component EscS [Agromyces cerinus]|uniref:hypothetical protein n=1 Tax=Agromyces cerinus TaxID=33878 RepID=UPI0019563420|nr:hypothetical protein [Agromyces cerinus]MBM7832675.1 type III secretory pathway component EscS [Agromyces cerinus]